MILHAFLLLILKFRTKNSEKPKKYGALTFPRFEIFLLFLALPGICKASTALVRGNVNDSGHFLVICYEYDTILFYSKTNSNL